MPYVARTGRMLMSVEEYLVYDLPDDQQAELVRGELRVTPPAGAPHSVVGANLAFLLTAHVRRLRAGQVFGDGTGYQLVDLPRTVRIPDTSFVRADRLPEDGVGPGLMKFSPDLAVEVLSPSETASALEEKLDDYHPRRRKRPARLHVRRRRAVRGRRALAPEIFSADVYSLRNSAEPTG